MREKIIKILLKSGKNGVLQEELSHKYGISKSTVSTVLQKLEAEGIILRKKIAGKSYRVWYINYSPYPVSGQIRVGILKAIEYPAVFLVSNDLNTPQIRIKIYKNAFSLTKDLAEGYLEVGCSPLITQVLFSLVYRSIRIKAGCGFRGGGIAMRKEEPKIFGSSELSTMEYSLKKFIELKKISAQIRYFNTPEAMIRALNNKDLDAIAIWEPYLTDLSAHYKIIRFEELFGTYPCCTLAVNNKVENSPEIRMFLDAYKKAIDTIPERKEEAIKLESKALKIKKSMIEKAFNGYTYNWRLDLDMAAQVLEEFGIKLTCESQNRIFNLL